jgi:hypothetical protein
MIARKTTNGLLALVAASLFGRSAAQATPAVTAAPMHSSGQNPVYPRLTKFPDANIMAKVNALLAAQEKADRSARADCLSQLKDAGEKSDADSYSAHIAVTYLSLHYLSVNVVTSYDCGGPYPTNGAEAPMTFDLVTGSAIDWSKIFKPGFLPPDNADETVPPSALTKLYRARYRNGPDDADCRSAIADQDPFADPPAIWLDSKHGLVVEPDFPHAIAACADEMALSPAELAPSLSSLPLLSDLRTMVNARPPISNGGLRRVH